MSTATGDMSAGALGTIRAAAFLDVSTRQFRTLASVHKWPRRYSGRKVLYAKADLQAYLDSLPSSPPKSVAAATKRLKHKAA